MCLPIAVRFPDRVLAQGVHAGHEWVITHNTIGYRCGYVRVPGGHPWHGLSKEELDGRADVHGGVTFAAEDQPCDGGRPDDGWWVGFDCVHAFDAPDPELPGGARMAKIFDDAAAELNVLIGGGPMDQEVIRDQAYVEAQCLSLCEQAAAAAAG